MPIGEKIKRVRIEKGLKQSELADISKVSRVAIGNYERGDRIPNVDILKRIAEALEVGITELVGDAIQVSIDGKEGTEIMKMPEDDLRSMIVTYRRIRKQNNIGLHKLAALLDVEAEFLEEIEDEKIINAGIMINYFSLIKELVDLRKFLIFNIIDDGIFLDKNNVELANLLNMNKSQYDEYISKINSYIEFLSNQK